MSHGSLSFVISPLCRCEILTFIRKILLSSLNWAQRNFPRSFGIKSPKIAWKSFQISITMKDRLRKHKTQVACWNSAGNDRAPSRLMLPGKVTWPHNVMTTVWLSLAIQATPVSAGTGQPDSPQELYMGIFTYCFLSYIFKRFNFFSGTGSTGAFRSQWRRFLVDIGVGHLWDSQDDAAKHEKQKFSALNFAGYYHFLNA